MKYYSKYIKSFEQISSEYEFAFRNLSVKAGYYNKLISRGSKVPSAGTFYNFNSFSEAQSQKRNLEEEIERKYTLELVAAFEAKSVYFFQNILKRRNQLYRSYQTHVPNAVRHGGKHLMYNHLIPVYKDVVMPADHLAYSEFKNLIEYRNWLAHGRGWDFPAHLAKFDFNYSYQTIRNLISQLNDYPETLKT